MADRSTSPRRSPGFSRAFFILVGRPKRRGTGGSNIVCPRSPWLLTRVQSVWSGTRQCTGGQGRVLLCAHTGGALEKFRAGFRWKTLSLSMKWDSCPPAVQ